MKEQPRRTLKRLIDQYGTDLARDSRRTEALLNDLCGQHRREIFVIVNAQKQRVPEELLAAPKWMPDDTLRARLERRLQEKLALTEDAAQWAVESWDLALKPAVAGKKTQLPWPSRWGWKVACTKDTEGRKSKVKASSERAKRQSGQHGVQFGGDEVSVGGDTGRKQTHSSHLRNNTQKAKPRSPRIERTILSWPLLWIAALGVGLISAWIMAAGGISPAVTVGSDSRLDWSTTGTTLDEPGRYLAQAYPPSTTAWVSEGPLLVRSGPSTEYEYLGMLEEGARVIVEEYSSDANWSRLSQPRSGWVNNSFLYFLSDNEPPIAVHLNVQSGYVGEENTTIMPGPTSELTPADSIPAGTAVIGVAVTTDAQWVQIAEPEAGWLHARKVRFPGE